MAWTWSKTWRVAGEGMTNWDYAVWKTWKVVPMVWEQGAMEQVVAHPEAARFVVRGTIDGPVESYLATPFKSAFRRAKCTARGLTSRPRTSS